MDIYIKNMKMPKKDNGAVLIIYPDGKCAFEDGKTYQAVHVPPHGRLIDEEVLIETIRKEVSYQSPLSVDALNVFAMVPTVIPASKEETCTKN